MGSGAGGLQFDLPLATVAMFNQQALNFSAQNSTASRAFLDASLSKTQAGVTGANTRAVDFMTSGINLLKTQVESGQHRQVYVSDVNQSTSVSRLANQPRPAKGGSKCFITTAVCESEGLPDDCETLMTLRKFRDEFMLTNPERAKLVKRYYEIAPSIVDELDALPDEGQHAYTILRHEIDAAIARIKSGDMEGAMNVYMKLVNRAHALAKGR
jgi:hypothetical protein